MTRQITKTILLLTFFALVLYDIVVMVDPANGGSISSVIWEWSAQHSSVPGIAGVLCGHWFWPGHNDRPSYGAAVLVVWGAIFVALDFFNQLPTILPSFAFLVAFCAGGILWGPETSRARRLRP
jgi:hypothetical protein